jgi:hypothetical protein
MVLDGPNRRFPARQCSQKCSNSNGYWDTNEAQYYQGQQVGLTECTVVTRIAAIGLLLEPSAVQVSQTPSWPRNSAFHSGIPTGMRGPTCVLFGPT